MPYANGQPTARELAAQRKPADPTSPNYGVGVGGVSLGGNINVQGANTGLNTTINRNIPAQSPTLGGNIKVPGADTGLIAGTKLKTPVSSNTAQSTTNTATVQAPTTPPPGSVSSIFGDGTMGTDQQFINDYIAKQNAIYNTPIDEAAIRSQKEAEMQAQIDAINKVYADKLNQSRIQGQGRTGTNVAQQARGGLLGSDFGTAQQNQIQDVNTQSNNLVEAERLSLVNALLADAQNNAAAEIANKRSAVEAGGKALLEYYAGAEERKSTKTKSAAQKLLALGKLPTDVTDAELKQMGLSRQDLNIEFTMGKQAQEAAQAQAQAEQQKTSLENAKTEAEINKMTAEGNMPREVGGYIFDAQGNPIGSKYEKPDTLKASDYLKFEVENEDGSKSTVYRNPITGAQVNAGEIFGESNANNVDVSILSSFSPTGQQLLSVPDGTVIPTRLGQVSSQNSKIRGKECAEYVNDIAGTKMGNTYKSKLAVCDDPTGGVGSVVAWKPNGSGDYGHTGIIVGEEGNNWLIKSSNYVPGTVTTEKIPKGSIGGYYTPESVKQSQQPQEQKAVRYSNGNVRTASGILYDKKEVATANQQLLTNDSYKALKASEAFNREWQAYKGLIDKYGIEMMPGKAKQEMAAAYERVMRQAQTFFNLGVLQKLDEDAVKRMIPSTARDIVGSKYLNPFERSGIAGQVKQVDDMIKSKIKGEYDSLNTIYGDYGDTLSGLSDVKRIYNTNVSDENSDVEAYLNQK